MEQDDLAAMVAADRANAAAQPTPGVTFNNAAAVSPTADDDLSRMVAADKAKAAVPAQPVAPADDDLSRMVAADAATAAAKASPQASVASDPLYSTVTPTDSYLQGVVSGVPIVGPALLGGVEKAAAYARSVTNGTSYSDELAHEKFLEEARSHEDPNSEMVGNLTGGTLTMGAAGATDAGGAALGMRGASLLGRSAAGAGSGAAIGAADAAVRSNLDPQAIQRGAEMGAFTGGMAPAVGKVIGSVANSAGDALNYFRPAVQAQNAIASDVANSGVSLADMQARMAANPRLAPMDVNPVLQSKAMGLAGTMDGNSRPILMDAYNSRVAGANGAVQGAYDAAMGPTPDVPALLKGMQDTARANAQQGFGAALRNAGPVDVGPTLAHIDNQLFPGGVVPENGLYQPWHGPTENALLGVRNSLTNGDSQVVDPNRLHEIQSGLRRQAQTLGQSANGQDQLTAGALQGVRQNLVTQIDQAAGGAYRPAQRQFADDMAIRDGFERGMSVFRNRTGANGLDDRPEVLQNWYQNASPGEQQAAVQGARVAADNLIRSTRFSARNGSNLPDIPANFDKLQTLLGPDEASNLQRSLQDEQSIAQTNHALFQNSMTQPRQAAAASVAVRPVAPFSYGGLSLPVMAEVAGLEHSTAAAGLIAGLLGGGAKTAASAVGRSVDIARNQALAKMLMSSGPEGQNVLSDVAQQASRPGQIPTYSQALIAALMHGSVPAQNDGLLTGGHH